MKTTARITLTAVLALTGPLLAASASAQNAVQGAAEIWSRISPDDIETVVVHGDKAMPPIWRLRRGPSEVWVLATMGPMPEDLIWNKASLDAVVAGARQVLLPPGADVGLVDIGWFLLWHRDKVFQPRGVTLEQTLPEPLRARFAAIRAMTGRDPGRYDDYVPLIAAFRLQSDFANAQKLTRREPRRTLEQAARKARVRVTRIGEVDVMPIARTILSMPQERQRICLEQAVNDSARLARDAVTAAEAWASGQVGIAKAHYAETKLVDCVTGLSPRAKDAETGHSLMIANALDAALKPPGKTVAVVPMGPLLRQGGVLERLAARGVAIEHP